MARRASYLICATPRSGTTLLCDLLTETGKAGVPHSYYRRQDIPWRAERWGVLQGQPGDPVEFDSAYLKAVLRVGTGATEVFGLRLMWSTVVEFCERLSRLFPGELETAALLEKAFGLLVYVHVFREDKVAQAISLLRAEQSGLWHLAADGTERQRSGPPALTGYDDARLAELVDELEHDDAAWSAFFAEAAISPVRVRYEDLAVRPDGEVQKILEALGCSSTLTTLVVPRTAKMADHISQEWRERFRQERAR
jgi:trehalose 2-sulfotransferase